jgi:hypothetical protein
MAAQLNWTNQVKAMRLAFWDADGVHSRKLELDHFHGQHGVDIRLLGGTHLGPGEIFHFVNCVCHPTDRLIKEGGTAVLST